MHFNKTFHGVYTDTATEIVAVYTTPPAARPAPVQDVPETDFGNMTKDEELDLALEALEGIHPGNMTPMAEEYWNKAITAIKQARSAPVQEPVAWMGTDIEGNPNKFRLNPFNGGVELYKKPQSVKVWDAEGYDALMQELELWKAAAKRKPLTLGQKQRLWSSVGDKPTLKDRVNAYGLAIEAAHGITDKGQP
jgi:hypothetical protein